MSASKPFDVAVIGAGVVGCGVARALTLQGFKVVLLERDDAVAAGWASGGNTGIACTAADCAPGTLEHALLLEAALLNVPTYERLNVPHQCGGALYVAWTHADADGPLRDLFQAHGAGGTWLQGPHAVAAAACATGGGAGSGRGVCDGAVAAVLVSGDVTVDPWLVPVAWVTQAEANGADVRLGTAVVAAAYEGGLWHLTTDGAGAFAEVEAAAVVNCGGLWADTVDALANAVDKKDALARGAPGAGAAATEAAAAEAAAAEAGAKVPFEVAPRRGDYLIYGAVDAAAAACAALPVGSVPLPGGGRGPYLWRTVHGDLVCGPTNHPAPRPNHAGGASLPPAADDQQAVLTAHSARVCKALASARVRDTYAGLRPALVRGAGAPTDAAGTSGGAAAAAGDYVVGFDADAMRAPEAAPRRRRLGWVTCAGARSTGLTASLAIGHFVAQLLNAPNAALNALSPNDACKEAGKEGTPAEAAAAAVVAAALAAAALHPPIAWPSCADALAKPWARPTPLVSVRWPRLPSLAALAHSFAERNDGCVEIRCTDASSDAASASSGPAAAAAGGGGGGGGGTYPAAVRRVTHPQTRFGLATRPPFAPLDQAHYPALASLIGTLQPNSPLAFLQHANAASVLRGGFTNALYLVRVPTLALEDLQGDSNGASAGSEATAATAVPYATWVVRKSAAGAAGAASVVDPLFGVHRICRDAEHLAVAAAAKRGLAPAALFDADASLLAQEYICEPATCSSADVLASLDACVDLLKALHERVPAADFKRPRDKHTFDVFETAQHYLSVVRGQAASGQADGLLNDASWAAALPPDIDVLFAGAARLARALAAHGPKATAPNDACRWPLAACHNDLVVGNLVRGSLRGGPRQLYLIDFEYSAPGDRCFDLANLCVNAELDAAATQRVVRRYLLSASPEGAPPAPTEAAPFNELHARVELLKVLSDLREGLWALAHGTTVASPLLAVSLAKAAAGAAVAASSAEEPLAEEGRLPASFYVAYGQRHLARFRKSLQDPALEQHALAAEA